MAALIKIVDYAFYSLAGGNLCLLEDKIIKLLIKKITADAL